jgi:branched-chain amino acid transport system ATP-binding protein
VSIVDDSTPGANGDTTNLLLDVTDLHAAYGPVEVLRGISFQVPEGDVVVILGANGAGKTTTLRGLCGGLGYFKPKGKVLLNGEDVTTADTAEIVRKGMAHVPQGRGTFPELTVEDNLAAGAYIRPDPDGVKEDTERFCELFPVLGERRRQPAGSLSGGEQQMLAVARALMSKPSLLLLDEPSLGLAPLVIQGLFSAFKDLNDERGTTMLLVEQNANLALEIASYGYVLEAGKIVLEGTSDELRADPAVQEAYLGA